MLHPHLQAAMFHGSVQKDPFQRVSYGDTDVQQTNLAVGDTIRLEGKTLCVLGVIDSAVMINNEGFTNGVQLSTFTSCNVSWLCTERSVSKGGISPAPGINTDSRVEETLSTASFSASLFVNDEIYCSLLGKDSYSEVYPTLQDNADTDTFENWLEGWCSEYPGTHWLSYLDTADIP